VARSAWPPRDRRVRIVENTSWQSGQLSSLLAGLGAPVSAPIEAAVVTLVDVPLVSAETVRRLVREWRQTRAPIVRPARPSALREPQGRPEQSRGTASSGQDGTEHGHPVIFDAAVFSDLRGADPATGAKPVVRAYAARIVNVPIDDPGAYLDVDTPEQYARAVSYSIQATA
jgi:molybdenum cofactor cytidylyltransferase